MLQHLSVWGLPTRASPTKLTVFHFFIQELVSLIPFSLMLSLNMTKLIILSVLVLRTWKRNNLNSLHILTAGCATYREDFGSLGRQFYSPAPTPSTQHGGKGTVLRSAVKKPPHLKVLLIFLSVKVSHGAFRAAFVLSLFQVPNPSC